MKEDRLFLLFFLSYLGWKEFADAATCPPLESSTDILLSCANPDTGVSISCNGEAQPGTTANYECAKFYTHPLGESDSGRMVCQSNGNWGRYSLFADFRCKLDCGRATSALLGTSSVIVNGQVTTRENFPWHVAIFRNDGPGTPFQFFCGGSLINPSGKGFLVLTAAHCATSSTRTTRVRPLQDLRIVLGPVSSDFKTNELSSGTQIFPVKAAKIHPNYNYDTLQNDISIMKLDGKVKVSEYVGPICFPTSEMANMQVTGNGSIAGFGIDTSSKVSAVLNFVTLPVRENTLCNYALHKQLTSIEFCAGDPTGKSICSGDSGGGLVFQDFGSKKFYVQGIASNVDARKLKEFKYCQNYNTFTRVSSFVEWINDELDYFFADDDDTAYSGDTGAKKRPPNSQPSQEKNEFSITVYEDYENQREKFVIWKFPRNCSSVPENWNRGRYWIDVAKTCLIFYEGSYCYGRSLRLQPTASSSLFEWNFPNYKIKSVSMCPNDAPAPPTTTTPPDVNQGVSVDSGNAEHEKVGLQRHNIYRVKHGVAPLVLSEELNLAATSYAYDLLTKPKLVSSGKGGENLYEIKGSSEAYASIVRQAVDLWYKTIDNYDWNTPTATSFSQMVWKATQQLGIGIARSGKRTIVVARYTPPGNVFNIGGDRYRFFRENVLMPRK